MKKRALLVALAAAMAASLAGCGGSSASSTTAAAGSAAEGSEAAGETAADASGKDSLVIVTSSDVLSMDPYRYDEGPTNQIMLHIYEAMVAQNADMSFGPCLAESWETSEDGLTWTFHATTSPESITSPSWNLTPSLKWKVQVKPSSEVSQLSARQGPKDISAFWATIAS